MLPVKKNERNYKTLDDIRLRKEELAAEIQGDSDKFGKLWNELFVPRSASTRTEFVSGLITNGITAVDTFLLIRKLFRQYGSLFGKDKKKKKRR